MTVHETGRAEAELIATAAAWDRAMITNVPEAIGAFMAEEWCIIGADGAMTSRDAFLDQIRDGRLSHDVMTTENTVVRTYGSIGVLIGEGVSAGLFEGQRFRVEERQFNVFVRQDGAWHCVLTHVSPIRVSDAQASPRREPRAEHRT